MTSNDLATETLGKPAWGPMLRYVAELHAKCVHPPIPPFPHAWEEIGTGYCYGPAFGHWDIVHAVLDLLLLDPEHARCQIENNLAAQQDDGLVPGSIFIREGQARWNAETGHPPVWPFAVQDYVDRYGPGILPRCREALVRQIGWFEQKRKASGKGFFYTDILNQRWESGVDEGIRFLGTQPGPFACVDATAHVFAMMRFAQQWGEQLGVDASEYEAAADRLQAFIQEELFVEATGFFHDIWAVRDPALRCLSFEGMWPMVVGAATPEQARSVIDRHLLNPQRFFSEHPLTTVSMDDPRFELRMWRGPAWNSMTYWAARGCMRYGARAAAASLLERALDGSAAQFERTGTVWEFYHPHGGRPEAVQRKPHTEFNTPCPDYLGHNPLWAMAALYEQATLEAQAAPNAS
jgi:putative isomerase